MNDIYVCGHRNPDTDSIVAAMAYANLRNALGDREYKAVRIGAINDETQRMLDRFGFEPPMYIQNMRAQVSDLNFDQPTELNKSVPLDLAWRTMRDSGVSAIPILNDDGTLYGMLSTGDIAAYDLRTVFDCQIDVLPVFDFDKTRLEREITALNPEMKIFYISAKTGEGVKELADYLLGLIEEWNR